MTAHDLDIMCIVLSVLYGLSVGIMVNFYRIKIKNDQRYLKSLTYADLLGVIFICFFPIINSGYAIVILLDSSMVQKFLSKKVFKNTTSRDGEQK